MSLVKANLNRSQRSLCAKLKCGVLPLAIETGRYNDTPEEKLVRRVCDIGLIESEYHHLLVCEGVEHVREQFEQGYLSDIKQEHTRNGDIVKCKFRSDR